MVVKQSTRQLASGIALIVAAFLCVAVMSAFGKAAARLPASLVGFFQSFVSLLLFLPWVLRRGWRDLRTDQLPLHVARALAGLLSQVLFFWAVKEMSLVDAVLLVNAAPLFIPIVAWLWTGQPITRAVAGSLVVGFLGVALIIRPSAALLTDPAALVALSAAACSAVALVSVEKLAGRNRSDTILFYYFAIASLATAPFAVAFWQPPSAAEWGYLLGVGLFMALAQWLIVLAYEQADATHLAPFNYSVVIFSALIGWIVWRSALDALSLAGIVLVCAGGILSIVLTKQAPHQAVAPRPAR